MKKRTSSVGGIWRWLAVAMFFVAMTWPCTLAFVPTQRSLQTPSHAVTDAPASPLYTASNNGNGNNNHAEEEEDFDNYSRSMSPKEERRSVLQESQEYAIVDKDRSAWRRQVDNLFRRGDRSSRARVATKARNKKPGNLILLLTGDSAMRANETFAGWLDPPITSGGVAACQHAARLLVAEGLASSINVVYTSRLTRAIQSTRVVLREWNALYLPVRKTYRLNGRMYGAVQGLSKRAVQQTLGTSVVKAWRDTLKAKPPPLDLTDPASPANDRRYQDVEPELLPTSESQWDCQERARPVWEYRIRPDLLAGQTVLVVAHKDSLRGIIQQVEQHATGNKDRNVAAHLTNVTLPSGVPVVYRFDRRDLKPVEAPDDALRVPNTHAVFLEKPDGLAEALERHQQSMSSFDNAEMTGAGRDSTVERALWLLRREQQLEQEELDHAATDNAVAHAAVTSDITTTNSDEHWADDPVEFEDFEFFGGSADEVNSVGDLDEPDDDNLLNIVPASTVVGGTSLAPPSHPQDDPVVVLVRHGRTPHNNWGLFTGWEDPPLAVEGEEDAKRAGRLLRRHGYEFDVVYTSQLTRAIQTASFILDELGTAWLPLVKSWRLNERMYGALTGKSKRMIETEYGKDQLIKWRRGYKIRPPAVSSFSPNYPGNDVHRAAGVTDLPIAWMESIARTLEQRKLVVHRRFPKTESLHDCMKRSIPFYTQRIVPEAVQKNKRVLIASHENAIRGILMKLCDIPEEAMRQLHLPNGLPLVYSVKGKCITLLEDDLDDGVKKTTVDDFGPAAKYLFRPCDLGDDFFEAMEQQQQQPELQNSVEKETVRRAKATTAV